MKRYLFLILICFGTLQFRYAQAEKHIPKANPDAIVTSGNMRFTVLTPELIRIEWSAQKIFEDRASFVVVNRNLPVPAFTVQEESGHLYITTDKLVLRYKTGTHPVNNSDVCDPNLQITLQVNGENIIWYPGKKDPYNLKGTTRTLDNAEGDVRSWLEDGLISRSGWAIIDEKQPRKDGSLSLMFDGSEGVDWVAQRADRQSLDWYFLGYGHDYKKALSDFTKIAGKIPMPPLWAFGYWYSKFQRYSEQDFRNIVTQMKANNIPLDVMVIDMDWHRNGKTGSTNNTEWTGWSWNHALFPNPAGFIKWLHDQKLKTTLNLHPADGIFPLEDNFSLLATDLGLPLNQTIEWNIENKTFYKAFFNRILRPHENIGVDFWWLDWQQWMIARNEPNLGNTFWLNHVFFSDKKQQQKERPLIFHRWGGLGNHRYPIGFSGDTHTSFASLDVIPEITEDIKIDIKPEDLRVDTYRASGAGGQHINKTDSAVRITHIPTGIATSSQTERSQMQNKENAMKMLKSKLFEIKEREHKEKIEDIKGDYKEIAWGSQIRTYVFHPYNMVKDHRTNYEEGNINAVMDGEIDEFIDAYLKKGEKE